MTNSIADILGKKSYGEPEEIAVIKNYVRKELRTEVSVTVQDRQIIITVPTGAMASALRPHLYKMAIECKTKKRLMIRIGK
jgi:predicted RNA-binding protein YlqC (UPF0109 family)